MSIVVSFEWTVEEMADIARQYFGAEEYEWVSNWADEDIANFTARLKSAINYQLSHKVQAMVKRYVEEEFPQEEIGIGPGRKYTVRNYSAVRILAGSRDEFGAVCQRRIGVLEGVDETSVPMRVYVQFPSVAGEYSGEDIRSFKYFDVAPVDAEEA